MTYPLPGQIARAGEMQSALEEVPLNSPLVPITYLRTTSGSPINNSTTYISLSMLLGPVAANEGYGYHVVLFYRSSATANLKTKLLLPSGATHRNGSYLGKNTSGSLLHGVHTGEVTGLDGTGVGVDMVVELRGTFAVAATAGDAQLQAAQDTLHASDTTIQPGSFITLWQLP